MFELFSTYTLQDAVTDYVQKLGPALLKRYGGSLQYTVKQVEKTVRSLGLEKRYIPYAIALYRHDASVNTLSLYRIDQGFLDVLREEMADFLFYGNTNYNARNVMKLNKKWAWRGGREANDIGILL
ncbi:MAG: hypothetical protein KAT25_04035 [Sulfuriflexus sp.]|nr:hypothetical protein [Sulfuriflexus sp.]